MSRYATSHMLLCNSAKENELLAFQMQQIQPAPGRCGLSPCRCIRTALLLTSRLRYFSRSMAQVSQMVGGELRTLIEGKEGTPVKLGLERREGPDMFGNRRVRRMVEIDPHSCTRVRFSSDGCLVSVFVSLHEDAGRHYLSRVCTIEVLHRCKW